MKLPSNKASLLILLIVILSTTAFVSSDYFQKETKQQTQQQAKIVVKNEINNDQTKSDSDGDGLLDWEEVLWGTDPQKSDTDGDGTNDSDEINQKRDPTVAGPEDEDISPEERILREIQERSQVTDDSLTSKVSVAFIENYLNLKGEGNLNNETKGILVDEIVGASSKQIEIDPVYNQVDIKTFFSGDDEKLINYAESFLRSQLLVLGVSADEGEGGKIDYIEKGENIISISRYFVSVEVPAEISKEHLQLTNDIYALGVLTKELAKQNEDPLYAMMVIPPYKETIEKISSINNSIVMFLKSNGIIIKDNEVKIQND